MKLAKWNCGHLLNRRLISSCLVFIFLSAQLAKAHTDVVPISDEIKQEFSARKKDGLEGIRLQAGSIVSELGLFLNGSPRSKSVSVSRSALDKSSNAIEALLQAVRKKQNVFQIQSAGVTQNSAQDNPELLAAIESRTAKLLTLVDAVKNAESESSLIEGQEQLRSYLETLQPSPELNELRRADGNIGNNKTDITRDPYNQSVAMAFEKGLATYFSSLKERKAKMRGENEPLDDPQVDTCYSDSDRYLKAGDLARTVAHMNGFSFQTKDLAQELKHSPLAIFNYVTNEIELESYFGVRKGDKGTLLTKSGNNFDIANLTVSLLRASGFPARYRFVQAHITRKEEHLNWYNVRSLEAFKKVQKFNTNLEVEILNLGVGGEVTDESYVPFDHVVVTACIPYSNYRGSSSDASGYRWVTFDPSYRIAKKYKRAKQVAFDQSDFLSKQGSLFAHEVYEASAFKQYAVDLDSASSTLDIELIDRLNSSRFIKQNYDVIPELPYEYSDSVFPKETQDLSVTEYTHAVGFLVEKPGGAANQELSVSASSHYAGESLELIHKYSSQKLQDWEDGIGPEQLYCASGETLSANYELLNRHMVQGSTVIDVIASGTNYLCKNGVIQPHYQFLVGQGRGTFIDGKPAIVPSSYTANSIYLSPLENLGVSITVSDPSLFELRKQFDDMRSTSSLTSFLKKVALKYNYYVGAAETKIAKLRDVVKITGSSVSFTGSVARIQTVYDLPYAVSSPDFKIDATKTSAALINKDTGESDDDGERIKILDGSMYESYIWQENVNRNAVSTINGLQSASVDPDNSIVKLTHADIPSLTDGRYDNDPVSVCGDPYGTPLCYEQSEIKLLTDWFDWLPDPATSMLVPRKPIVVDGWKGLVHLTEAWTDNELSGFIAQIQRLDGGFTVYDDQPALWDGFFDTSDPGFSYDDQLTNGYDIEPQYSDADGNYLDVGDGVNSLVNVGDSHSATHAGDPVNMVTGNMYLKETDFVIKTQGGLPIVFSRSYNSLRNNEDGPLGFGWTHSFNQRLKFVDTDENNKADMIIWVDASGGERAIKFSERAINDPLLKNQNKINLLAGDAIIPDGFYFSLERPYGDGNTSFVLVEKNGTKFFFEAKDGGIDTVAKLEAIEDRIGNRITVALSGGEVDFVQAPDGRILDFNYKDGLLDSILFDWTGNGRHFSYSDKGELEFVSGYKSLDDPKNSTSYAYMSDGQGINRHLMRYHKAADGSGYHYNYYSNGKVKSHRATLYQAPSRTFYYNDYRRETVTVDERGQTTSYFFNEHGLPLRVNKPDGGQDLYQYKDSNDPMLRTSSSNLYGLETINEYDTAGNVVKMTLPSKNTVEYFYFTPFGQPQIIKNAAGDYTLNKHNALGQLTDSVIFVKGYGSQVDPGNVIIEDHASNILQWSHYEYDNFGNLIFSRQIDDFTNPNSGPSTVFEYNDTKNNIDGVNRVKAHYYGDIDGLGIIGDGEGLGSFDYEYNAVSMVSKGFNSQFYPVQFKYNLNGQVTWGTDQLGNQRNYFFDRGNKLTNNSLVVTKPEGVALIDQISYEYDKMGRITQTMNNEGVPIVYEYDPVGNTKKIIAKDGFWVEYEHDPSNRVTKVFDEEGNAYQKFYDQLGRTRKEIDPEGLSLEYEYYGPEQDGRVKAVHGVNGRSTYFVYNALGLVTKTTSKGRFGSSGGPPDQVQEVFYDAMGRPIYTMSATMEDSVLGSLKSVTHYQYDALGNKTHTYAGWTKTGSPQAATLKFQEALVYDDFGRVKVRVDALNKTWRYTYDVHGNVKEVEEPNGRLLEFDYGYGGLLKSKKKSDNSDYVVYERNELGQIKSVVTPAVDYTYTYDAGHRIKKVTDKRRNKDIVYHYTVTGMLDRVDDPEKGTVRMIYDPARRLTGVRTQDYKTIHYVRDKAGRITEEVFPNGVSTSYSFKPNTVLLEEVETANRDTGELLHSANYTYSEGLLQSETLSTPSSSLSRSYQYDALGRIRVSLQANGDTHIGYDPFGNRRYVQETGKPREVYIHNDGHQLKEIRRNTETGTLLSEFEYDDYGNMLSRQDIDQPKLTLTYDSWDRLKTAEKAGSDSQAYEYDHLNRRVAKTVGTEKTHYVYAGANIAATYDKSWTQMERFAYGQGIDDPVVQFTGASDDPLYFHQDRLGSVVATSGPNGQMLASAMYDAWGNIENSTGAKAPSFGYTGREHDETGLIYNRARYYDPSIGRFISADPMGFINGVNRYTYALNNPTMYIDPWGYSASSFTDTLSGSLYDAAGTVIRTVAEMVPYVESVNNIIIDHDVDLAVENAAIESGMILAGAVSGGTALGAYKVGKVVDGLADAAVAISKIFCSFDEDTLVSTPDGFKAIGALSVGDLVLAKEPITGIVTQKPIKGVFDEAHDEVIKLTLSTESGEEVITTTREHPFYVEHIGWVSAGELWIGVRLQSLHDQTIVVSNIETIEGDFKARNLYVADFHTYAVGESEAWVHNRCKPGSLSGPVFVRAPPGASAEEILQVQNYCAACNNAIKDGALSPTGRVPTQGQLRREASREAAIERQSGNYQGHAGHVPDTTWTGTAKPHSWMDLTPKVNTSLGGQTGGYPIGFKPTEFIFVD